MRVLTKAISFRVFSMITAGSEEGQRRKLGANTIDRLEASIFVTLDTSDLRKFVKFQRMSFKTVLRIPIRIHFSRLDPDPHWEYGSGSRRAKMNHKSEENSSDEVVDVLF
jgi:hypothetical protein